MPSTSFTLLLLLLCAACDGEAPRPSEERHVPLAGEPNFRDVGGYATKDGRTVKWGHVYRSGELSRLSAEDVRTLDELGLRTVVIFLTPEEIAKHGSDRLPEGTRSMLQPIVGENVGRLAQQAQTAIRTGDFERLPPSLAPEIHRLLLDDGKEAYAALIRAAMDPANRPLAYHCSHGVHRTGTATALLLSALGVPWETVRRDYLLSNTYRGELDRRTMERIRQGVAKKRGVAESEVDMTNVEAFFVLQPSYIDGTLERAVERHGSMEAYIRDGLGISDEEIGRLRAQLLD